MTVPTALRMLIDKAGVSLVHGHSSHHPRAVEIYRDRLILYGCADFLNDYEEARGNCIDGRPISAGADSDTNVRT
jgi:Bacterial capsule synthesis protein PGA_cap